MFMARFLHRPIPAAERHAFLKIFDSGYEAAFKHYLSVSKAAAVDATGVCQVNRAYSSCGEYDKIIQLNGPPSSNERQT